ncbi:ABC-2 type transport system permease protein [Kibdelosporangium banguiense]|uniref:Transport permease protein n=1 Tax=Kibdelosporangium banguiense TaxID=1365924 RepID=A0ABS4TFT4_9PSEU|nr:ABC transporter permease [Kibdelosporangium banguiense]MBP2323283.1 ABC-2 type transport system permease protein [Kibdelosporangium banguiense]
MSAFKSLSGAGIKTFTRDKAALFFTFLFPLMFLVVFGLLFRDAGTDKIKIGLAGDGPVVQALQQLPVVEVTKFDTADAGIAKVKDGDLPGVVIENGNDVQLRFAVSDQTQAGIVQGLVSSVVDKSNIAATGQQPRFQFQASQVEDNSLNAIQYLTPGILSWAVASAGVFGSALTFVAWRKKQVLRRLWLAPVSPLTVLGSRISVTLGVAVVQAVLFIGIATLPLFGLKLSGTWALSIPVFLFGMLAFFAIGLLIGSFAKTEEAANGAAQIVILPMAFLSGTFFPIDRAPGWLQTVSEIFPLRHMNDGMQDFLVRGKGVEALLLPCGILLAFTLVIGFIATRLFRWDS